MKGRTQTPVFLMLFISGLFIAATLIMQPLTILNFGDYIDVLFPQGKIAVQQRNLLLIIQGLMLLVIIPVYILTFIFSWIYRAEDNPNGNYDPDLVDNIYLEYVWWGVPLVMTLIVCTLTWYKTAELDPYRPIVSEKKALRIQAVALQWKWLFIYPEEKIATVNIVQFPKDVPLHFEITADAPMNSFWIPDLGGQIYAMPNMKTELYLIANALGDFRGYSANLSGEGFATMRFTARATSEQDFKDWVEQVKQESNSLNLEEYEYLAAPSKNNPQELYQLKEDNLFDQIIGKYGH